MKNHKNIRFGILIAFTCLVCVTTQATAQKTFAETLDIHLNAIRSADLAKFEPTVSDSITHISPMGDINYSKTKFIKLHQDWFKRTNWQWEGTILEKHSNSSLGYALIEYAYSEKDAAGNTSFTIKSYLTLIFKKYDTHWKLVYDQNTIIPKK